ncbi:MAG: folate-binding protein [Gammaproteobacteria bacterium]|nr:folate-binding protein [Gammaproteobacteria bacterium]
MTIKTHENQFGLLCIEGADAAKFLQGQLTCNMDEVTLTQSCLGAHCNPQGRIISLFDIFFHDNKYYLLIPFSMIPIAMKGLKKYAVFFKTTLTDASDDNYLNEIIIPHKNKIEAGIPTIYPETSEKFLPHEINLQYLNGISFNKGCYTGQEIIARMHYRGHLKKHMYQFHVNTLTTPIPGSDIYNSNEACGIIVDSYQENENDFQLLIILNEADSHSPTLFLSLENKEPLNLMPLPYSF